MVTEEELAATVDKYERICEDAYKKAGEETQTFHKHWLDSPWSGFFEGKDPLHVKDTGVHEETLTHIAKRCDMFLVITEADVPCLESRRDPPTPLISRSTRPWREF